MRRVKLIFSHLLIAVFLFHSAIFTQSCDGDPPPRVVNFDVDEDALDGLTPREQMDQLRDWLLLTALSDAGLRADKITKASFDLPAVRHGFLRPIANYEYGETRSRLIADGKVLALLPINKSPDERNEYLARIADEHRKNTGEIPATLLVANYDIDVKAMTAKLSQFGTVNGRDLFTDKYYTEATVKSFAEVEQFLNRIDDLTYVEVKDGQLVLGGRKFAKYPARRLRVEDVASIWQSERSIHDKLAALDAPRQARLAEFNARWKQKIDEFNARWGRITASSEAELAAKERQSEAELAKLNKQREQELAQLDQQLAREEQLAQRRVVTEKVVSGSGFSLDPHYDYEALKGLLPQISKALLSAPIPRPQVKADLQSAAAGLAGRNANPFFELIGRYAQFLPASEDGKSLHRLIEERGYSFQSARYDGELRGTEVGMVLFYTDLLAKLWAINYLNSTPTAEVPDFRPMTNVPIARIFKRQIDKLSGTRVWFGHSDKGFHVANDGATLLFGRNATRVFAASHPGVEGDPSTEVPPAADAEAFIGWWNDHYEEIARKEPEYLRLNQIIKWSLLIGWLNHAGKGDLLGFLNRDAINVDHSAWFPKWVQRPEQKILKFKQWESVGFYPKGYRNSETEVMRLLSSEPFERFCDRRVLSGGVSLPGRGTFENRAPLPARHEIEKPLLRSDVDSTSIKTGQQPGFNTRDGASYNFTISSQDSAEVAVRAPASSRPQSRNAYRSAPAEYRQSVASNPGGDVAVGARLGESEIGSFSVSRTSRGFNSAWYARDIQKAEHLARRLSQSPESGRLLATDPDVVTAIELPNQQYLVQMRGSNNWLRIGSQITPTMEVPAGFEAKAADVQSGVREILIGRADSTQVASELSQGRYVVLQPLGGGESGRTIQVTSIEPAPGAKQAEIEINTGNGTMLLSGRVDPTTGALYLPTSSLPGDATAFSQVRAGDLRQMRGMAQTTDFVRYQQTARPLTPADLAQVQKLAAELKYDEASGELDKLISRYGRSPELMLLKSSILIRRGRFQEAVNSARLHEPPRDLNFFYDQLHELHRHGFTRSTRENLRQLGEYIHWKDRFSDPTSEFKGRVIPIIDNGKFRYEMHDVDLTGEKVSQIGSEDRIRSAFYVQDATGFSKLDWNVGFNKSLDQAVMGEMPAGVFKLSRAEIADAAPHRIFDNQGRSYTLVKPPSPKPDPGNPTPNPAEDAGVSIKLKVRPQTRTNLSTRPGPRPTPMPTVNDMPTGGPIGKDCVERDQQNVYIIR
jgi:hypothetical protein